MMLPYTEQLGRLLGSYPRTSAAILASYCKVIALYGDREDAAALFRLFQEQPGNYRYVMLLEPVMRCGDLELAEEIDHTPSGKTIRVLRVDCYRSNT